MISIPEPKHFWQTSDLESAFAGRPSVDTTDNFVFSCDFVIERNAIIAFDRSVAEYRTNLPCVNIVSLSNADFMGAFRNLLLRFGLADTRAERTPISVFLLDDDKRRHKWFENRFIGDGLDVAENVDQAKELLAAKSYDAI